MPAAKRIGFAAPILFALAACGGGSGGDAGGNGGGGGGGPEDPLARAEAINFTGTYEGDTDWGTIDRSVDQHILAADMAFLVREMEVANMTPGREFLQGNLQNSMAITGGCGGTFQTTVPGGGTPLASAGTGTFDSFCLDDDDAPMSGAQIDPYVLVSGSTAWDIAFSGVELNGYSELEDVVVQWRGEEFTLNTRLEFEGEHRFYVMDVTLHDTTYRFYGVFIPGTTAAPGAVFWAGLHPEFGKFRIDQDLYNSDDQILGYGSTTPYPACLGPTVGAQTMSEPAQGAEFQFRAAGDCLTYTLSGQDSAGAIIDSSGHEWLDALISES